ncbi:MAG: DNA polymerase III subunit gamma/tau [Solirubrobacteraceae bacterium]
MPSGPSLYRRHRPRSFADVVGQEHVVRTLRNAIEQGKVHHAYLFVGSRGTGKTSMAKILAACLNCEQGPTVQPCGVCDSCVAIASATSLDVIEMDAASHNGVDDMRELREQVAYAPVSGRHKVYILDEAHMITTAAWNAFLKTLEEPPPNTVFVLATTEAQKVLPTVADRCHRFDFQRPSADEIARVLGRVADAEGFDVPPDAAALVARHASGSFRDALGTLEQLVTYGGPQVRTEDVLAVLGVADADLLYAAVDAAHGGDVRGALVTVARLSGSGRDPGTFFGDLEAHCRDLLVVQAIGEVPPSLRLTPDRDARLAEQAQRVGQAEVVRLLDLLAAGMEAKKAGADARTQLELALVKAAAPEVDPSTRALLARIDRLEARLADAGAASVPAAVRVAAAEPVAESAASEPVPAAPAPAGPDPGPAVPPPAEAAAPSAPPAPDPAPPAPAPDRAPSGGAVAAVAVAAVPDPDEPVVVAAVAAGGSVDLDTVRSLWPAVIDTIRPDSPMLAALVEAATPVSVSGSELRLGFARSASFLKRKAEDLPNRQAVSAAIESVLGQRVGLAYELVDEADVPAGGPAPLSADEWVERFVAEFDAEEIVPDDEPEGGS